MRPPTATSQVGPELTVTEVRFPGPQSTVGEPLRLARVRIPQWWLAVVVLACAMCNASASEVRLALLELATKQTTFYGLNLESGKVQSASGPGGADLESSTKYEVQNYKVKGLPGEPLAEAIEILRQATFDGHDILLVRQEYNSANPMYWLAAMSGHPVQVSKIVWLDIKDGKLLHSVEIARKPVSYHWQASLRLPD